LLIAVLLEQLWSRAVAQVMCSPLPAVLLLIVMVGKIEHA
jgi:hypothetical protein